MSSKSNLRITLILLSIIGFILLNAFVSGVSSFTNNNGSANSCGSPGETSTCSRAGCHGAGNGNNTTGGLPDNGGPGSVAFSAIPAITGNQYVPNQVYTCTVTVSENGKSRFGFGIEMLDNSGNTDLHVNNTSGALTVTDIVNTRTWQSFGNGRLALTHNTSGGFAANTYSFHFNWTAPSTGTVNMYLCGNAANNNDTADSHDNIYTLHQQLNPLMVVSPSFSACPSNNTITNNNNTCTAVANYSATAGGSPSPTLSYTFSGATSGSGSGTGSGSTFNGGVTNVHIAATNSGGTANCNFTITVNAVPSVTVNATQTTICTGTPVTFTATTTNGGSSPNYQWKKNNINVGSNMNTYTDNALVNGDVVKCVITSNLSCATPTTASSNAVTITLSNSVTPLLSIAANPGDTICSGTLVTFTASPVNGGSAPVYQWTKNSSNVGSGMSAYTDNSLISGDIIGCAMTSNAGCLSSSNANSNNITMTVNTNPAAPAITQSGNILNSNVAGMTYQWFLNGFPLSGATAQTYSVTQNGSYSVTITNSSGCSATSAVFSVTGSGIIDRAHISDWKIYPDPFDNMISISSSQNEEIKLVTLRDPTGRIVKQWTLNTEGKLWQLTTDDVAEGMYLLELIDQQNKLLVKQKIVKL